jgi:threonine/homoserine/homoserine lactone efflux protein
MHEREPKTMTEQLLMVVGITALGMLSPGPDMLLVMRNTLLVGRRAGGWTAAGVLTGNLVHITYCALGLGMLLTRSPRTYAVLRYASAVYLAYLALQSFKSRGEGLVDPTRPSDAQGRSPYVQGLINNLLNAKGILFFLGVFTQVITPELSPFDSLILVATMVSVSASFWLLFVQTLHLPAIRERLRKYNRAVDRAFGVLLLAIAVRVALD